jgi:hypothetical protein
MDESIDELSLRKIKIQGLPLDEIRDVTGENGIGNWRLENSWLDGIIKFFKSRKMEILMILLLIIIFIIIINFSSPKDPYLESFKPQLSKILDKAGIYLLDEPIPIHILKSNDRTYTMNKQKIYMVTEKPNGEKYNRDTLLFVLLHEIAHILSPDEHHTKDFHRIEKRLHSAAIDLGYIRKERLDKSYPCSH